jgi:hypothetical protein
MLRILGAPALALTIVTAAAPQAHAAHRHHHAAHAARHHHVAHAGYRHYGHARRHVGYRSYAIAPARGYVRRRVAYSGYAVGQARGHGGRPSAWCGWYARSLVGQDPGPGFNLARNWARWGRPARPAIGVMVVWAHHVGMITGQTPDGQWIVKSGNDGHAVRERPRSLGGAIAFRAS